MGFWSKTPKSSSSPTFSSVANKPFASVTGQQPTAIMLSMRVETFLALLDLAVAGMEPSEVVARIFDAYGEQAS